MKMKFAALAIAALAVALPAHARKDTQSWPIADILSSPDYAAKIGDFKFGFGGKVSGAALGTTTSRGTTNGFGKSDHDACVRAALNALIKLKEYATSQGGTAVRGVVSTTTGQRFDSTTEFQCVSGTSNSRVYFDGTVVK